MKDLQDLKETAFLYYSRHVEASMEGNKALAKDMWNRHMEIVKEIKEAEDQELAWSSI